MTMDNIETISSEKLYEFGELIPNGCLTGDYDNTLINFRDMIKLRENLGRPLSEEESKRFIISSY